MAVSVLSAMCVPTSLTIKGDQSTFSAVIRFTISGNKTTGYVGVHAVASVKIGNKTYKAQSASSALSAIDGEVTRELRAIFTLDENAIYGMQSGVVYRHNVSISIVAELENGDTRTLLTRSGVESPKFSISDTFTITNEDGTETPVSLYPVIGDDLFSYVAVDDILPGKPVDMLVKGYSKASITFDTGKVETKFGATVAKIDLKCEGDIYSTEDFTQPVVTSVLASGASNGNVPVIITVTDSRGFGTEAEGSLYAYGYSRPVLTGMSAYRSDKDKNENDEGTYLTVQASERHTALEGENSCVITAEWGVGGSLGSPIELESGIAKAIADGYIQPTSSYVVRFTARDDVGNENVISLVVPTPSVTFDALNGGNGFAFGKMAERDGVLESVWDISSHGSIQAGVEQREEDGKFIPKAYMDKDGNIHADGSIHVGGELTLDGAIRGGDIYTNNVNCVAVDANSVSAPQVSTEMVNTIGISTHGISANGFAEFIGEVTASGGIAGVTNYPAAGVEELTGGTWINGDPIYRQVLQYTLNTTGSTVSALTIEGFNELVSMTGSFYRPTDGFYHQLNFYASSSDMNYAYMRSDGVLRLRSTDKAVVTAIVEYTKK